MKSKQARNAISRSSIGKKAGQVAKKEGATVQFESRFIADMAFQIRTLSHAIVGFSELLRYEELTDSQTEYVSEICRAGQSVVSLVDNVLELSKIESGQLNIDAVICSFSELLERIDLLVRPCADEKGLDFEIFQCTDLPANIRTDPARLCQCVISLANNAVKFTDEGYVHLKVSLEDCNGKPSIRFDVADSGVGIPVNKQKIIFEPFARIKDENECEFTSPGLGLTITRYLVKLLGGKVSVTSKPHEGSVFSLVIPAGVDIASTPLLEPREPSTPPCEEPEGRYYRQFAGRVLLAEDQPSNRTVMSLLLEAMGMRVSVAEDGVQAVEKATTESFDLILMDIKMPKMDGYEAMKKLKEKGVTTPVVALSAASPSDDAHNHIKNEFDCFLTKPVDSRKLQAAISKYLPAVHAVNSNDEPAVVASCPDDPSNDENVGS
jgi:CheY-like chemotaxis protein